MLQKKIKASAITNLTDARYFAAMEVEWLSFNFEEGSDTFIEPGTMKAIREWVDGVEIVGEFPTQTPEEIQEWAKILELKWVQVSSKLNTAELTALATNYQLIQEIVITETTSFEAISTQLTAAKEQVVHFQLNFETAGLAWETLDSTAILSRAQLQQLCQDYSIILSIPFQPENLTDLSDSLSYAALNLQGGEEEKVGFKSFDDLDAILEQLEVEN